MTYHYHTFMALYHGIYLPLGLHSGPNYTGKGHPGYDTVHGLAAFLRVWAENVVHGRKFTGKAWGVHLGTDGTLHGSYLVRLGLHHHLAAAHREVFSAWVRGSRVLRFTLHV